MDHRPYTIPPKSNSKNARQGTPIRTSRLDILEKNAYNHSGFTAMTPQQYSVRHPTERGPVLKGPRLTRRKDSGGAGTETSTVPFPYQKA